MKYIFLVLFIFFLTPLSAQEEPKEVRLDAMREAWLAADTNATILALESGRDHKLAEHVRLFNLGYLYYLQGNNVKALDYLEKARKAKVDYPFSYLILGHIYEQSGNLFSAKSIVQQGLEFDPDQDELVFEMARIAELLNDSKLAVKNYQKYLDNHSTDLRAILALSRYYRSIGDFAKVEELLLRTKDSYPESSLLEEQYNLYRQLGQHKLATEVLTRMCLDYPHAEHLTRYRDTLMVRYGVQDPPMADGSPVYNYKVDPNEALNYTVEYGFITLGWLKVRIREKVNIQGKEVYRIVFFVDSNPSFDFMISLHHIYESYIDINSLNSLQTRLYTPDDKKFLARMYYCDYDHNEFRAFRIYHDGRLDVITKDLPRAAQDGTSMLYYARGLVSNKSGGRTTVIINEQYKIGDISFLNEIEEVEAGDKDYDAIKIYARANFEGIAGMNGDAWGWFAPDESFAPVIGKVKIIVGSISLTKDE